MAKATQLTICMENKPGQGAKMTEALAKAKVSVLAISVVDTTDTSIIRVVPDSATKAAAALQKAGMKPTRQNVLVVSVANEPGTVGAVAGRLAKAGININYLYGSAPKGACEAVVIIGVDDVEKATKVVG